MFNFVPFPLVLDDLNGQQNQNDENKCFLGCSKTLVPSMVTNSFHTQHTQESPQQQPQQQLQNQQQVVTALNGNAMAANGLPTVAANSNPSAGMNSVALQRAIAVPGLDQQTEQLQSVHSNASSYPNYTGLTIPNQSE